MLILCFWIFFIVEDDLSDEKQAKRASNKEQHKEFVQRMHAKNGNA
jgi:hypothetical protein